MNFGLLVGALLGLRLSHGLSVVERELWVLGVSALCGLVYVRPAFSVDLFPWRVVLRFFALVDVVFFFFSYFPEYRYGLYQPAIRAVTDYAPALAFLWIALAFLGRDLSPWPEFLRSLPVRVFFAPMMFGFLHDNIKDMPAVFSFSTPVAFVSSVSWLVFFGDLVVGTLGYILPGALFRAGLRGVDVSLPGLFFCLVCYPPFWATIDQRFVGHEDGYFWADWVGGSGHSPFAWMWAGLVAASLLLYLGAVLSIGFRFSNLLYKGLCDTGVYSLCRHPQYTGKILFYWLNTVPFVSQKGFGAALAGSFGMAVVTWVYYMRAVTEERFLAQFPDYREYAACVPALPFALTRRRWLAFARSFRLRIGRRILEQ